MFSETAELYDLIYGQFKDYADETRRIAELVRGTRPEARTVLDVGCGTGEHARLLARDHGFAVDGIDIEPGFVRLAQEKNPDGRFVVADMVDFDLGRRYDAVLCLFSSIGYVTTPEKVERALRSFREHLEPYGVVVVEPWIEPEEWNTGKVFMHTAESDAVKVCRLSHSGRRGRISTIEFHYLIGSEAGIEHRTELHELLLLRRDELEAMLRAAGFDEVRYDPNGLVGRGIFIARAMAAEA